MSFFVDTKDDETCKQFGRQGDSSRLLSAYELLAVSENVVREKPFGMEFDHTLRFIYFVFKNFENKTLNAQHAKMFLPLYIALQQTRGGYPLFYDKIISQKRDLL